MVTRIPARMIETTGVTAGSYSAADITVNSAGQITSASTSSVASSGGGPKITSIVVTDSSYTNTDDTAVGLSGGYIKITGTGFSTGCSVIIGTVVATSVSFINSTEVRAQVPAQSAGTYTVYLTNSDGGVAIRVNGLNYSSTPTWTTTSPLAGAVKNTSISLQLIATSNSTVTYTLQAGSSLPSGLTLSSSGLITGTTPDIANETTYNFTVVATDLENQDTPQAFQITIVVNDPYYELVTLHLPGTGTNLATNNTFLDGSTNNFTITRNGNTTQGTFSPFSQTGWGNYFSGSNYIYISNTSVFDLPGDFTIEFWWYPLTLSATTQSVCGKWGATQFAWLVQATSTSLTLQTGPSPLTTITNSWSPVNGRWYHIAFTRSGTDVRAFVNGSQIGTTQTSSKTCTSTANMGIGANPDGPQEYSNSYISNLRITKGQAFFTGNFNPATSLLTTSTVGATGPGVPTQTITGTVSLLTCQSNRFIDNSTNNFTITANNGPSVVAFSPFNPTASWSAATYGGSGYFDGNGDYLTLPAGTAFAPGTGDFTVDGWFYTTVTTANQIIWSQAVSGTNYFIVWADPSTSTVYFNGTLSGGGVNISSTANLQVNAWNYFSVRRASGTVTVYLNGVAGTPTSNTVDFSNTSYVPTIGRYTHTTTNHFTGYIANLRYVKGTAITPSGVPTTLNTAVSGTSALLNFTNAGIYDATSKNDLETVGNAQISTAISAKWGSGSIYLDGTNSRFNFSPANLFILGTAAFTFETWFYPVAAGGSGTIFTCKLSGGRGFYLVWSTGSVLRLLVNAGTNWNVDISSSALTLNTWHHIAVTRSGSTFYLLADGSLANSQGGVSGEICSTVPIVKIGSDDANGSLMTQSYLQDTRFTNGIARYTGAYTVPTAAFPTL